MFLKKYFFLCQNYVNTSIIQYSRMWKFTKWNLNVVTRFPVTWKRNYLTLWVSKNKHGPVTSHFLITWHKTSWQSHSAKGFFQLVRTSLKLVPVNLHLQVNRFNSSWWGEFCYETHTQFYILVTSLKSWLTDLMKIFSLNDQWRLMTVVH